MIQFRRSFKLSSFYVSARTFEGRLKYIPVSSHASRAVDSTVLQLFYNGRQWLAYKNGQTYGSRCLFLSPTSLSYVALLPTREASPTETEYCLKSEYGFPVDDIPLTNTGNIKTIQWRQWIKFREVVDAHCKRTGQPFSGVDCPDLRSVVFRTSGIMYDHPPNKVFRTILASKEQQRAEATTLLAKRQATEDVIREIYDLGFQFLLWNKDLGYYVPCSDQSEIKRHVFQSWRDQIKRSSAQQNRQALNSSNLEHVFSNQDHHDNRGRDAMVGKKRKGEDQEGGCFRAFYR